MIPSFECEECGIEFNDDKKPRKCPMCGGFRMRQTDNPIIESETIDDEKVEDSWQKRSKGKRLTQKEVENYQQNHRY